MFVKISKLYDIEMCGYDYNQLVEREIQILISRYAGYLTGEQSQGNTASFDYYIGPHKIEQKIKSDVDVQMHYYKNNKPCCLLLSKSDIHLIISLGTTTQVEGGWALKVRLYNTQYLRSKIIDYKKNHYILNDNNHLYLGEIPYSNYNTPDMGFYTENFRLHKRYHNDYELLRYDLEKLSKGETCY